MDKQVTKEALQIEIVELLRLEFEIESDLRKLQEDLKRVIEQRALAQSQVKLIENNELSPEEE